MNPTAISDLFGQVPGQKKLKSMPKNHQDSVFLLGVSAALTRNYGRARGSVGSQLASGGQPWPFHENGWVATACPHPSGPLLRPKTDKKYTF